MRTNFALCLPTICLMVIQYFQPTHSSEGETLPLFHACVIKCHNDFCQQSNSQPSTSSVTNWIFRILWSCHDDCEYDCMWPVIHMYQQQEWGIPQFHGKWPFIRWLGMQESASAIFSLLNLVSIIYMFKKFYTIARNGSVMYWIWIFYTAVSINAWFWSILFHIRDTSFSEKMDYMGATCLIYATLGVFGFRILLFRNWSIKFIFIGGCCFFFSQHVLNIIMRPLDYDRNLDTLLLIAFLTGASTMIWCLWNWRKASHVQFAAIYIILIIAVAPLEIYDFPPMLWTFDAHALWHLATVPLQFFIYKFAMEDCKYLQRLNHQKNTSPMVYQNLSIPSVHIYK